MTPRLPQSSTAGNAFTGALRSLTTKLGEYDGIKTHWPLAVLLVLMGLQAWVQVLWIRADGGVGDGVCCGFTAPVLEILLADATDQLGWPWSHYRRSMGLLVWPALAARKIVGANPDFLLATILLGTVFTQGFLYDIGRRLVSPLAGLIAAGLYPMIPAVAYMTRRWDAMAPQHFVLVLGFWCLVRSEGFARWRWTLGFALVAMVGCVLSARETDNLLFMAAIGAMALGPALRGLLCMRWRSVVGALALAGGMALFCQRYAFPLVDFAYFQDEMGNRSYEQGAARMSLEALLAYPMRLYTDDLTPWLAVPFVGALVSFLRRGPARAELLSWLILPLLALGFVGKKNFYYAAIIYPVVPIVLGLVVAQWRPRQLRVGLAAVLLVLTWLQWSSRSLPTSTFPKALATVNWNGQLGPQAHLFQGMVPLHLGPRGPSPHARELTLLAPRVTTDSCDCPQQLMVMGNGDFSDLYLQLKMTDPCLTMSMHPRIDHPDSVGWVLETRAACGVKRAPKLGLGPLRLVDQIKRERTCSKLWRRDGNRLCGTYGSPPNR
jgi:hypothetical protein